VYPINVWSICENSKRSLEMVKKDAYLKCLNKIGLCIGLKILFFKANGIVGFDGHLNLFPKLFLVKKMVQCVIKIYK
jgi:hypothetical protein